MKQDVTELPAIADICDKIEEYFEITDETTYSNILSVLLQNDACGNWNYRQQVIASLEKAHGCHLRNHGTTPTKSEYYDISKRVHKADFIKAQNLLLGKAISNKNTHTASIALAMCLGGKWDHREEDNNPHILVRDNTAQIDVLTHLALYLDAAVISHPWSNINYLAPIDAPDPDSRQNHLGKLHGQNGAEFGAHPHPEFADPNTTLTQWVLQLITLLKHQPATLTEAITVLETKYNMEYDPSEHYPALRQYALMAKHITVESQFPGVTQRDFAEYDLGQKLHNFTAEQAQQWLQSDDCTPKQAQYAYKEFHQTGAWYDDNNKQIPEKIFKHAITPPTNTKTLSAVGF